MPVAPVWRLAMAVAALAARTAGAQPTATYEATARAYRAARTVQADFEQLLTNPVTGTTATTRGRFAQRGAARFDFRFTQPPGERVLSDGEALWLYLPSTMRGQVLRLPGGAAGGLDVVAALLLPGGDRYDVAGAGRDTLDGVPVERFTLVPRGEGAPFTRATAWIDPARRLLRQFEATEPSGLVRRVRFARIRLGGALPADAFRFTVPEGVRVVDQASLLGGPPRQPTPRQPTPRQPTPRQPTPR